MSTSATTLRERQAEQVRTAILDAAVDLLESGEAAQLTVPQIAEASGVSLRTVYRYYATREELLVAAGQHARERLGLRIEVHDVDDIVTSWLENSARVAANPELGRALLDTTAGRQARAGQRGPRVTAIAEAFAELGDRLPEPEATQMRAVITYLCGSGAFLVIGADSGIGLDDARAGVRWALTTLLDAAREAADESGRSSKTTKRARGRGNRDTTKEPNHE